MSMNEETARAGIRVRKAEKVQSIRVFIKGGVQKRRALIVSKLESFYGCGGIFIEYANEAFPFLLGRKGTFDREGVY